MHPYLCVNLIVSSEHTTGLRQPAQQGTRRPYGTPRWPRTPRVQTKAHVGRMGPQGGHVRRPECTTRHTPAIWDAKVATYTQIAQQGTRRPRAAPRALAALVSSARGTAACSSTSCRHYTQLRSCVMCCY